tara:strand:- start:186 stop:1016 length:831 start_codon:yes stop_codon:yes gene_type:complete
MKINLIFIIITFLSFELNAQGLIAGTYHSDGSITDNNGKVIRKSYADRYQEALDKFNNGEEIEDWPTVKKNKKGKTFGKKGFFGENILEEGAPLLAIDKVSGSKDEILNNIAKQNGYVNEDILKLSLVANSSKEFKIENNISNETFEALNNSYQKLVVAGILGENLSDFDDLSSLISNAGIDPETGNAILAPDDGIVTGGLINDEDIQIEGIDPGASLAEIAESLDLDSSLVTSKAMAETLSAVSDSVSNDVSSTADPNMSPAIDPNTGNAPLPPG